MKNRDFSLLLIPLIAAMFFSLPSTGIGPSSPPGAAGESSGSNPSASAAIAEPDKTAAAAQAAPSPSRPRKTRPEKSAPVEGRSNAARLLYEFFGFNGEMCRELSDGVRKLRNQYKLEFMIATLPDPMESQMNYLFDRNLDAMQRAIESADYVLDRFYFPWQEKNANGEAANKSIAGAGPGVILFRSRSLETVRYCPAGGGRTGTETASAEQPSGRLLLVFVIGDTPVSGVNKTSLIDALNQIALLSRWREADRAADYHCLPEPAQDKCPSPISDLCWQRKEGELPPEIRIIGPTFSGSADSLELSIQSWLDSVRGQFERPIFSVISGSATSISQCQFCRRIQTPGQPVFHATVPQSQPMVEAFIRHLSETDRAAKSRKIAILQEANTAYGQSSLAAPLAKQNSGFKPRSSNSLKLDRPPLFSEAGEAEGPEIDSRYCPDLQIKPPGKDGAETEVLRIPYPLHISQLRSASEKAKSTRNGFGISLPDIRRPLLPLLLEEEGKTNDVVPLFSKLEPASIELVLSELLEELNREQIRHIGIISTDVKDSIFLVSQIRRHCPNTTVFMFYADMLFMRPEVNVDMRGTLVVTPYPLFGPNQFWSYPVNATQSRFLFPAHVTEGVYNATLAMLGRTNLAEYGPPFERPDETGPRKPALWLTMVGRSSFLPIKLLPYEELMQPASPADLHRGDRYLLPLPRGEQNPQAILNLAGGLNSKSSTTIILLLIVIGLIIPVVTLSQLLATKSHRLIEWLQPAGHLRKSWLGELFGDSVFPSYKMHRRFFQMLCNMSLLMIYLPAIWVFLVPYKVRYHMPYLQVDSRPSFTAVVLLIGLVATITLISAIWLWGSVVDAWWQSYRQQSQQEIEGIDLDQKTAAPIGPETTNNQRWLIPLAITVSILTLLITLLAGYWLMQAWDRRQLFFVFIRATDLTSGVSPLLPILLIGFGALLSAFSALRRWNLVELIHPIKHWETCPDNKNLPCAASFLNFEQEPLSDGETKSAQSSFAGVRQMEVTVSQFFECPSNKLPGWLLLTGLMLICFLYVLIYRFIPTVESRGYDWLFRISLGVTTLTLALAFLRFVCIWFALRRLLRRLSSHPLFADGDETKYAELPKIRITAPAPSYPSLSASVNHAIALCRELKDCPQLLKNRVEQADATLRDLLDAKSRNDWRVVAIQRSKTQLLLAAISRMIAGLLEPGYSLGISGKTALNATETALAETFLAGRLVAFLHYALAHLQNLVIFVTAGILLMLMAITSYPFQPRDLLLLFGWLMILTAVAVTIWIFVQMDRDKVLSLLSGGDPGKLNLNRDFIFRVIIHGLLPILALLSVQFPETGQQILSWLSALQGGGR